MRIGIDATCWQDSRGFGRFTRELVARLVTEHCGAHEFVLVTDAPTAAIAGFPVGAEVAVASTRCPAGAVPAGQWRSPRDLLRLGRLAGRCGADVFWFPTVATYYPVLGWMPVVITVHDAMTETRPELFFPTRRAHTFWRAKVWLARLQASVIVTPSESARQAVAAAWRWPMDRVARIDEAPAEHFRRCDDPAAARALAARYGMPIDTPLALYVGGIDPHKNLEMLLHAMADLRAAAVTGWHLAIVGEPRADRALGPALVALRDALGLTDHVTLTGFVPDADLSILYNAAALLVQPSLDEGFGLPVIEAMACGVPVAVSNRGSLPALAGDAGLTFDPADRSGMSQTIGRLLQDADLRRTLGARALARAASFTWTRSARQLMDLLQATGR